MKTYLLIFCISLTTLPVASLAWQETAPTATKGETEGTVPSKCDVCRKLYGSHCNCKDPIQTGLGAYLNDRTNPEQAPTNNNTNTSGHD